MKPKTKAVQLAMHCRCGRETMLAHGMCATCYTLRRKDEEHFGGLRETVLERDGYRCRVCDAPGTGKRSIIVHHRVAKVRCSQVAAVAALPREEVSGVGTRPACMAGGGVQNPEGAAGEFFPQSRRAQLPAPQR